MTQGLHPGLDIASGDATVRANTEGRLYMYQTWNDDEGWHVQRYDADDAQYNTDLDGFGSYVVMETEINGETYYQVMAYLDGFTPVLRQGQQVQAGTVLGTMGETGYTDGPHVHWEIRRDDAVRTHLMELISLMCIILRMKQNSMSSSWMLMNLRNG